MLALLVQSQYNPLAECAGYPRIEAMPDLHHRSQLFRYYMEKMPVLWISQLWWIIPFLDVHHLNFKSVQKLYYFVESMVCPASK